jgi:hypothetical protein
MTKENPIVTIREHGVEIPFVRLTYRRIRKLAWLTSRWFPESRDVSGIVPRRRTRWLPVYPKNLAAFVTI